MAVKNSLTSMWAAAMQPKQEDIMQAGPRGSANVGVDSLSSRDRLAEGRPLVQPQVVSETSSQPLTLPENVETVEECKVSAIHDVNMYCQLCNYAGQCKTDQKIL